MTTLYEKTLEKQKIPILGNLKINLFVLIRFFDSIIDKFIDESSCEYEDTYSEKERRKCRNHWEIGEEEIICECPDTTPEEDDSSTNEKCFNTTFPEVLEGGFMFEEFMENHGEILSHSPK